jgi:hypothetical protein
MNQTIDQCMRLISHAGMFIITCRGFFQGVTPPLIGSALYRGSFLSAYEFGYTFIQLNTEEDHFLKQEYLGMIRPMVPLACMLGVSRHNYAIGVQILTFLPLPISHEPAYFYDYVIGTCARHY